MTGAPVTITSTGATTSIAASETVSSNNSITVNANSTSSPTVTAGTISNAGILTTTSAVAGAGITVQDNNAGNLVVAGNGTYSATGAGAHPITFQTSSASSNNELDFTGSPVITPGATGTVLLSSAGSGGSIVLEANQTVANTNGSTLHVVTPNLTMKSGTFLRSNAAASQINIDSGSVAGTALTITAPSGGTAR